MRTFYTESDIDDLAASGVQQLELGADVVLDRFGAGTGRAIGHCPGYAGQPHTR